MSSKLYMNCVCLTVDGFRANMTQEIRAKTMRVPASRPGLLSLTSVMEFCTPSRSVHFLAFSARREINERPTLEET